MTRPRIYSRIQIGLHWLIAVLIVFEFVLSDQITTAWNERLSGVIPDRPVGSLHAVVGLMIVGLMLWRGVLLLRNGLPPLPKASPRALRVFVRTTEGVFYATLLALPLSGAVAWYAGVRPLAGLHHALTVLLLLVVAIHIAGAVVQQFLIGNNMTRHMLGLR